MCGLNVMAESMTLKLRTEVSGVDFLSAGLDRYSAQLTYNSVM